ncbi:hypothetical protein [Flavivirga eckloniae]|uniref:Pectate lyase n=1 Tax=Flavivirga eckloniae TaxID=1803846 RepID=A0A2K9PMZ8_9FLAO|nr:hypothetical protein [Flavivirga eckloniae]AUP78439.1 hypothetical protein C1H87_06835 [Flavivirga eckloniae]
MKQILIVALSLISMWTSAQSLGVYLSPKGNDANNGTELSPIKSVAGARELITKAFSRNTYDEVKVLFTKGDYKISEELVFDSTLFTGKEAHLTLKSSRKIKATISGGKRIKQ